MPLVRVKTVTRDRTLREILLLPGTGEATHRGFCLSVCLSEKEDMVQQEETHCWKTWESPSWESWKLVLLLLSDTKSRWLPALEHCPLSIAAMAIVVRAAVTTHKKTSRSGLLMLHHPGEGGEGHQSPFLHPLWLNVNCAWCLGPKLCSQV